MSDREPKAPKGVTLYDWHEFLIALTEAAKYRDLRSSITVGQKIASHVREALAAYDQAYTTPSDAHDA